MTTDRDFDLIANAWLAAGPDELPGRVIDAVAEEIHVTRQRRARRVPWRFPTMGLSARASALLVVGALVAVVGVAVLGGVGATRPAYPTPAPSTSLPAAVPSAAARFPTPVLDRSFTSTRNGFTIAYPAGWTATPGTTSWSKGTRLVWGNPALDVIETGNVRLVVGSQRLDPGQSPTSWIQANCQLDTPASECAGLPGAWEKVTVDGVTGYRDADGGTPPFTGVAADGVLFAAEVVTADHAYEFAMDGHVDRPMFDAFLATVKLPLIPTLDQTFVSPLAGYSIGHPADWGVAPATTTWTTGHQTASFSDRIGTSPSLYGTSTKLPAGMSFNTWFADYDRDRANTTCSPEPSHNEDITIDGLIGRLDIHCQESYLEAVIPKGGRVYVFTMFQPFTRPLFERLLETVRLTPETAKP